MTVSSQTSNETFYGNGVTTLWDLPFRFFDNGDIHVYLVDPATQTSTPLSQGADYTLSGAGLPEQFGVAPGKIMTTYPVVSGKQLYVERVMDVEQLTDIVNQGRFFAEVHEDVFDRITMLIQQTIAWLSRALVRPVGKDYYDAEGRKIVNLGDGQAEQDAVNIRTMRSYVDSAIAGVIGGFGYFIQAGIGAVMRTFQDKQREQPITIEDYISNVLYVEAPYGQAQVDAATPIDDALDQVIATAVSLGRKAQLRGKVYKKLRSLSLLSELNFEGESCGHWLPTLNQSIAGGAYVPDMEGTVLLFCGNGTKDKTALGVTDCRTGGGVVANDNIHEPGFDSNYSLTNFYNDDANFSTGAAATPKLFSTAVYLGPGVQGVQCKNMRFMPSFKGVEGYKTGEIGYGDLWDVGIYTDNAAQNNFDNVQAVGYWQMNGRLSRVGVVGSENVAGVTRASIEHNIFRNCVLTGMVGAEIRGLDSHRVIGRGADYIDVPWAANHPFDVIKLAGLIRTTTNVFYNFTGVAVVAGNLRLTGVTPSPAALALTASIIPAATSNGMAMFTDDNCIISGMDHQSGNRVTAAAMGAFRKTRPSTGLMISGNTLRGYSSPQTKIILQDDVAIHLHWAIDVRLGPKFEIESKDANGLGLGARIISSPAESLNTRVPNPSGSVFRLDIDTLRNTTDGIDYRPVGTIVPPRFPLGSGYVMANQMTIRAIHDNLDDGRFIRPGVGKTAGVKRSDGARALYYDDAALRCYSEQDFQLNSDNLLNSSGSIKMVTTGDALSLRADIFNVFTADGVTSNFRVDSSAWTPNSTDGVINVGNPVHRMNTIYAVTGMINTSDARLKTGVRPFTADEIAAVKEILGEIGMYQFLSAVAEKGEDAARWHAGLTVQRAIEIFEAHNIDPFKNAFICYDQWPDEYDYWPAEYKTVPAVIDPETGAELEPETKVLTKEASQTLNREAGDLYSFRNDQLALAMLAGVSSSLDELDQRLAALEAAAP